MKRSIETEDRYFADTTRSTFAGLWGRWNRGGSFPQRVRSQRFRANTLPSTCANLHACRRLAASARVLASAITFDCVRTVGDIHHRATNFRDKYFTDGHYAGAACSCDINYGWLWRGVTSTGIEDREGVTGGGTERFDARKIRGNAMMQFGRTVLLIKICLSAK